MDTSNDDLDLKRAVALSVQEQEPQPSADNEVIDVGSEGGLPNASVTVPSPPVPGSTSHTLLGLDREAMEHERLARKRKASISPSPPRKAMKEVTKYSHLDFKTNLHAMYLDGVVKKTKGFGRERKDDILLEEILLRDHLELAVLSSFQWDIDWVLRHLQKTTTQLYFVMQAKNDAAERRITNEMKIKNIRTLHLCFPSMAGPVKCMHSTLMLLSYPSHLRVVVPTADLVEQSWEGYALLENTVFLIDLPRKPDGHHDTTELTAFGKELVYFLQAMELEDTVVQSVHNFDFSKTKDMAFVHTVGGVHIGKEAWGRTGYCGLGRAVKQLGLDTHNSLDMDFVTSSMGSLNIGFLTTLYLAAQGDDGLTEYTWRYSKKTKAKTSDADKEAQEFKDRVKTDVSKDFHIYFPTRDEIVNSKGSVLGGGGSTICFEEKWYESPTFPQQLLRDCKSRRKGMLMHNKIILVRQKEKAPQDLTHNSGSSAWAYIGSANCSESAWGKLIKDGESKEPKLHCRNWECGVLIPMRSLQPGSHDGSDAQITQPLQSTDQQRSLQEFEGLFPVPMQYPGEEYGTRRPWFNGRPSQIL